jgi:hypothetical protein
MLAVNTVAEAEVAHRIEEAAHHREGRKCHDQ